jgi:hypothetical protein
MYHWIITLQWPGHQGFTIKTLTGTLAAADCGGSRETALTRILAHCEDQGAPSRSNILCFTLEPNSI